MAAQGHNFKRNKHLQARKFFAQERIEANDIMLRYCKMTEMAADIMTKAVEKATLNRLKKNQRYWHLVNDDICLEGVLEFMSSARSAKLKFEKSKASRLEETDHVLLPLYSEC